MKLKLILIAALLVLMAGGAHATTSTVDPNYPADGDEIDAAPLRGQFQAAHDDINEIFDRLAEIVAPTAPPSCSLANQALTYSTDSSSFGCHTISGTGTVTSVQFTGDGVLYSATPSAAVTSSGSLSVALLAQSGNLVLAGPANGTTGLPSFRSLVGADLPNPAPSTLGGVFSLSAASTQYLTGIGTNGLPTRAQPQFSDLAGNIGVSQMNSGLSATATTYWDGSGHWSIPPGSSGGGIQNITLSTGLTTVPGFGPAAALSSTSTFLGIQNIPNVYTGNHTVTANESFDALNSSTTGTFLIPAPGTNGFVNGVSIEFVNEGAGAMVLTTTGSGTFAGMALTGSNIILRQYGFASCTSDGATIHHCAGYPGP